MSTKSGKGIPPRSMAIQIRTETENPSAHLHLTPRGQIPAGLRSQHSTKGQEEGEEGEEQKGAPPVASRTDAIFATLPRHHTTYPLRYASAPTAHTAACW